MSIHNENSRNIPEQKVYDAFNTLMFSSDVRIIGKLLYRFMFFEKVKCLPGDICELGVFKGSGMATWLKFLELFVPYSNKKVIGFDIFQNEKKDNLFESFQQGHLMTDVVKRVPQADLSKEAVAKNLEATKIDSSKYMLIEGDICHTVANFCKENPGFRCSLLYIDVDLSEPTYHALISLWDRIVPGGYILFDEYEYHKFDESNGVDRFLKEKKIEYSIESTNFLGPTAFMMKKL
jgi:hypothetical protein